jgi:hypothetical protein
MPGFSVADVVTDSGKKENPWQGGQKTLSWQPVDNFIPV